jgi:putative endonuclease
MFYVYVLKSDMDKLLYIGCTNSLDKRISQHNEGASRATKSRKPLRLVYYEAYLSLKDARTREARLKKFKNAYTELKKRIEHSLIIE